MILLLLYEEWGINLKLKIINRIKKIKLNGLKFKIWLYLTIFSILILSFLWIFQILFLDSFYENTKITEINKTVITIKNTYTNNIEDLTNTLDYVTRDTGVCIQIQNMNSLVYDSSTFNRGCIPNIKSQDYKKAFIQSLLNEKTYKVINPVYNNEVLIKALKLDENTFAFVSSSLEPLDSAIGILQKQLVIITLIVLILSFLIGFYISKKISSPIEKINKDAKKLGNREYNTVFAIDDDIDELNELVNTLNEANKELAKTEELKRELMANVSHDLKTPLTMIKAYAEMVRDLTYKNKEKREENLNVIIDEADRLNYLVNDILELSTIESNNYKMNITSFDISDLIIDILRRYQILEQTKKYDFIFENKKGIIVSADKKRIEQVIYNLLNNAVNYTGNDKKVYIKIIEDNNKIRVEITDTGKGIKKEDLNLIWKKYYKVDKKYRREKVGTGIGLSIVESILKAHNTKYGVDSILNKGTTFWFILNKND